MWTLLGPCMCFSVDSFLLYVCLDICFSPVWSVGGCTCCWCHCARATGSQGGGSVAWGCSGSLLCTKHTQTVGLPSDTNRSFHAGRRTCTDGLCRRENNRERGKRKQGGKGEKKVTAEGGSEEKWTTFIQMITEMQMHVNSVLGKSLRWWTNASKHTS